MKNLDHDKQSKNDETIVSIRDKCVELQYFVEDPLQIHKETVLDEFIFKFRWILWFDTFPVVQNDEGLFFMKCRYLAKNEV